jgi:hypothetical protein
MYSYRNICQHFFAFLPKKNEKVFQQTHGGEKYSRLLCQIFGTGIWEYKFLSGKNEIRLILMKRAVPLAASLFREQWMGKSDNAVLCRRATHRSPKERLVPDEDNAGPTRKRNRQKKLFLVRRQCPSQG